MAEDIITYNCVPVRIEVFKVGTEAPVATAVTRAGPVQGAHPGEPPLNYQTRLVVDAGPADETHPYCRTQWKIRFTNQFALQAAEETEGGFASRSVLRH